MAIDKIQLGGSEGGIVEEGSNSNGAWTKWESGRMECLVNRIDVASAIGRCK